MTNDRDHGHITPAFDILDTTRTDQCNRAVLDHLGYVEPHIEETDGWCSMPVRLVFDQAAGLHLEVGPYDLDAADIDVMRRAIAAYDAAVGRQ